MNGTTKTKLPPLPFEVMNAATSKQDTAPAPLDATFPIAVGLVVLMIAGVLAFGAVYPSGIALLQIGSAALFIAMLLVMAFRSKSLRLQAKAAYAPMLFVGALILFQLASGHTAYWYVSYQEALLDFSYLLAFVIASEAFRTARAARFAITALALVGPAISIFAILESFTRNGKLYWLLAPETPGYLMMFGQYVSRNHYAGMIELLAPFSVFAALQPRTPTERRVLHLFAAAIMYASVGIAASRAGVIVCAIELLLIAALYFRRSRGNTLTLSLVACLAVCALPLLWLEPQVLLDRFRDLPTEITFGRGAFYRDALHMIFVHPWTGFGLHTFATVYPHYRSFYTDYVVNELHNDWLQAFVELGIIGGLAICIAAFFILRDALRLVLSRGHATSQLSAFRTASLVGVIGLMLHGLVDFNMHVPANAFAFFILCAWATNRSAPLSHERPRKSHLMDRDRVQDAGR